MTALLRECGYLKISEAFDGEMALRSIRAAERIAAPVDFIITDCAMPQMDGLALIRALRGYPEMAKLPILMTTAHATLEHIVAARDAGADDYLVKPFNATTLGRKIEDLLVKRGIKNPRFEFGRVAH